MHYEQKQKCNVNLELHCLTANTRGDPFMTNITQHMCDISTVACLHIHKCMINQRH